MHTFTPLTQETQKEKGSVWEVDGEGGKCGWKVLATYLLHVCGNGMMKPTIWIMKHANSKKMALGRACGLQLVFFPSLTHSQTLPAHTILVRGSALRPFAGPGSPGALQ